VRVLYTCHRFLPAPGGTETAVGGLADAVARAGHEVTVATSLDDGLADEETLPSGVRVRRFPLLRVGRFRLPPRGYAAFAAGPGLDLVHLHGQRVWSTDHLHRALARARVPVVFTPHGFHQRHVEGGLLNAAYDRLVLAPALRRASAVVALTAAEAAEAAGLGARPERVVRIPGGVHLGEPARRGLRAALGVGAGERLLLSVGGFYRNKRVDRLVRAAAAVGPGVHLVVVGPVAEPREREAAEGLAAQLGVRLHVTGVLPRDTVVGVYAEADLLVAAPDWEGFGLALLEAMAAGLPWVSTPVGAAPELARTGAGRVAGFAPDALGAAVRGLLEDPAARAAASAAGPPAARLHAYERIAAQHLALYRRVLEGSEAA